MIQITPYHDVNGAPFGCDEATLVSIFGVPLTRRTNHEGEIELHYPNYIARLDAASKRFREFTLLPDCPAKIAGIQVRWGPTFLSEIQNADPELVQVMGFVLSLKLGLAFSGFHDGDTSQMAIHAFRRGDWDSFKNKMSSIHFHP